MGRDEDTAGAGAGDDDDDDGEEEEMRGYIYQAMCKKVCREEGSE